VVEKLIGTVEAAARLGVSARRVCALIKAKRLKARRIGHSWVIDPRDLAAVADRPNGWPAGRPRKIVAKKPKISSKTP
jgi:excisionase family DNA binding protein